MNKLSIMNNYLYINEIFYSIQGEDLFCGKPCVFIRLAGCNLRCKWCDTTFAWNSDNSDKLSINDILQKIATFDCKLVLVTGGEPLLQPSATALMQQLIVEKYEVLLETNGSVSIDNVPKEVHIALDIKCPGSNMEKHNNYDNINLLKPTDTVKFIVKNVSDFEWAVSQILQYRIYQFCNNIIFSAVHPNMKYRDLANCILKIKQYCKPADEDTCQQILSTVRLQLQLHKIVWESNERGR